MAPIRCCKGLKLRLTNCSCLHLHMYMQSFVVLDILVTDCSKFMKQFQKALDERSQFEPTIRELESVLFSKDQDIQDMNVKSVELSQKCAQLE